MRVQTRERLENVALFGALIFFLSAVFCRSTKDSLIIPNKDANGTQTTATVSTTYIQNSDSVDTKTVTTCTCVTFQEAAARKQQDQPKIIASNSLAPKPFSH